MTDKPAFKDMRKCSGGIRNPIGTLTKYCASEVDARSHHLVPLCEGHLFDMLELASRPFQSKIDELEAQVKRDRQEIAAELTEQWASNRDAVEERLGRERFERSRVYFMRNGKYIKIGFTSTSPETRLDAIRKAGGILMPKGLDFTATELIGHIPGDLRLEKILHKKFASIRVAGEWFKATPELTDFIEKELTP